MSVAEFYKIEHDIEIQHISKQKGFISRKSAVGDNHDWLVIVHWDSVKDAEVSMSSFIDEPAAKKFTNSIDASSMKMSRYVKND